MCMGAFHLNILPKLLFKLVYLQTICELILFSLGNQTHRISSFITHHSMSTVGPISQWHVLCTTSFMVPLCTRTPQSLALFLWEEKWAMAINHFGGKKEKS